MTFLHDGLQIHVRRDAQYFRGAQDMLIMTGSFEAMAAAYVLFDKMRFIAELRSWCSLYFYWRDAIAHRL